MKALGYAAVGVVALIGIGYAAKGPVLNPDGTMAPRATVESSLDAGVDSAGGAAGRGFDHAVDKASDALAEAALESDVMKGVLVTTGGVAVGAGAKKAYEAWRQGRDVEPADEPWCQEVGEDGSLTVCPVEPKPAEDAPPAMPELVDGPVFDLGEPPVLVDDDMDLGLDDPSFELPPIVLEW